jgi:hypothetical protein
VCSKASWYFLRSFGMRAFGTGSHTVCTNSVVVFMCECLNDASQIAGVIQRRMRWEQLWRMIEKQGIVRRCSWPIFEDAMHWMHHAVSLIKYFPHGSKDASACIFTFRQSKRTGTWFCSRQLWEPQTSHVVQVYQGWPTSSHKRAT